MSMEFSGRVALIQPEQGGTAKNGNPWRKQEVVFELPAFNGRAKRIAATLWGDNIDKFNLQTGEQVNVQFDLESREYNGRYYTEVRAYAIRREGEGAPAPAPARAAGQGAPRPTAAFTPPAEDEDLPF